jgi:hypothetical protein
MGTFDPLPEGGPGGAAGGGAFGGFTFDISLFL